MEDFFERLNYLIDREAGGKYSVFAKKCGIPASTFYNYTKDRMPHSEHLSRIHETFNIDLNWLLTGKGDPYLKTDDGTLGAPACEPEPSYTGSPKVIELQHMELVKGFKDKPRALSINRELKKLEDLDPEEFKMMEAYIKGAVDMLQRKATAHPPASREGPRGQDDAHPQDRRSGTDRRTNAGGKE